MKIKILLIFIVIGACNSNNADESYNSQDSLNTQDTAAIIEQVETWPIIDTTNANEITNIKLKELTISIDCPLIIWDLNYPYPNKTTTFKDSISITLSSDRFDPRSYTISAITTKLKNIKIEAMYESSLTYAKYAGGDYSDDCFPGITGTNYSDWKKLKETEANIFLFEADPVVYHIREQQSIESEAMRKSEKICKELGLELPVAEEQITYYLRLTGINIDTGEKTIKIIAFFSGELYIC